MATAEQYQIDIILGGTDVALAKLRELQTAASNIGKNAPVGGDGKNLDLIAAKIDLINKQREAQEIRIAQLKEQAEQRSAAAAAKAQAQQEAAIAKEQQNRQKLINQIEQQAAKAQVRAASSEEDKRSAQILAEMLRYKQQLAAIQNAGFSAQDAQRAKQMADELNRINLEEIEAGAKKAKLSLTDFLFGGSDAARDLARNLQVTASQFAGVGAQIKAFKSKALEAFGEFKAARGDLSVYANDVQGVTIRLKALAGELRNQVSVTELTANSTKVARLGYRDTADNLAVLSATQKLAITSGTDYETSLRTTTDILKAFKLPASEAGKVTELLFKTAKQAGVPVGELAPQFEELGATAAATGLKLGDLAGFIALTQQRGVPAEQSISAFNAVLDSVQTGKLADDAEKLGINLDRNALQTQGFAGALQQLRTNGVTSQEALAKLFGSTTNGVIVFEALNGGLQSVNVTTGELDKGFNKLAENNKAKAVANDFNDALVIVGEAIAPVQAAIAGITKFAANLFRSLPEGVQTLIGSLVGVTGAGLTLAALVTGATGAIQTLLTAIATFTPTTAAATTATSAAAGATAATGAAAAAATPAVTAFGVAFSPLAAVIGGVTLAVGALSAALFALDSIKFNQLDEELTALQIKAQGSGNDTARLAARLQTLGKERDQGKADVRKEDEYLRQGAAQVKSIEDQIAAQKKLRDSASDAGQKASINQTIAASELELKSLNNTIAALKAKREVVTQQLSQDQKKADEEAIKLAKAKDDLNLKAASDKEKLLRDAANKQGEQKIEQKRDREVDAVKLQQEQAITSFRQQQEKALGEKKLAFERQIATFKEEREKAIQEKQRAFDVAQQAAKQAFADAQRKQDESYQSAKEKRQEEFNKRLTGANDLVKRETDLATAKTPEDRAKLEAEQQAQDRIRAVIASSSISTGASSADIVARAKQAAGVGRISSEEEGKRVAFAVAEIEAKLKQQAEEEERSRDRKYVEEKRAAERAFSQEQDEQKIEFLQTQIKPLERKLKEDLNAQELTFKQTVIQPLESKQAADLAAFRAQQEQTLLEIRQKYEQELDAFRLADRQREIDLDNAAQLARLERESAFKQQQRDLDLQNAQQIADLSVARQFAAPSANIVPFVASGRGAGAAGVPPIQSVTNNRTNNNTRTAPVTIQNLNVTAPDPTAAAIGIARQAARSNLAAAGAG